MGLSLSGKPASKKSKKLASSRRGLLKMRSKSDVDSDEEVIAGNDNSSDQKVSIDEVTARQDVPRVPSFEGGFVHTAFSEAVSAGRIK